MSPQPQGAINISKMQKLKKPDSAESRHDGIGDYRRNSRAEQRRL
jgi:hypothetical protein